MYIVYTTFYLFLENNYIWYNRGMSNYEWFKKAKYGLMIHFGLYSCFGGEYKGKKCGNYAEWIQSYFRIPNKEMEIVADNFNPVKFDAEEWVKFASDCGFGYIVFVTKHHDGFAMFDSVVDKYNIVNTPFGRDILRELSDACRKYDIKLGVYYSQDLDWHEYNGGGYTKPVVDCAGTAWCNDWDYVGEKNFDKYFNSKALPQIKEIFTNYGEISVAWFDVPFTLSENQSQQIYDLVKECQPNCLINSRIGNGKYDYVSFGDNEIPDSVKELKNINSSDNDISGIKYSPNGLYEVCQTLNQSWGYTKYPKWKTIEKLRSNKLHVDSLGINYLVNISPNELGEFPTDAKNIIKKLFID